MRYLTRRWIVICIAACWGPPLTATEPWQPVGLSGGGGMFTPAISPVDPDLMMVNCDMSAAYISENGGRDWRMIHHAQLRSDTRCRPCFHPKDANVIYASSRGRLRVSRDRGQSFSDIGDLKQPLFGEIAMNAANPEVMLVGTRDDPCFRSADGGITWKPCRGPRGALIGFHFDQTRKGRTMLAATDRGIWRSDDGGETWQEAVHGLPWTDIQGFAGGSNSAMGSVMLYCSVKSRIVDGEFAGGLYVSRDRGQSWQSAMGRGTNTDTQRADQWSYGDISQYVQVLTTDQDPMRVYATNTSTGFHPPHHDTVYRSDDGGKTWRDVYFMDPRFKQYNVAPNYVTASTGQSYKGGDAPFGIAICNSDPDRIVLVRSRCYVTHDGGGAWFNGDTRPAAGATAAPGAAWTCTGLVVTTTWHYYIDPHESHRHYIAYTDIGWARSVDSGKTWAWWDKDSWAPWRNTCYEVAFDPEIPGKMWGAFSDVHDIPNDNIISERHGHSRPGGVCVSRDFGRSWQVEAKGMPEKPVTSIVIDPDSPSNARVLYAGVFGEGVYRSSDDGKTWALKRNGLGDERNRRVSRVLLQSVLLHVSR
jgi:photosystem II stability/assembly factor-like uncharacterized protein